MWGDHDFGLISDADLVGLVLDIVRCFGSPNYLFPLLTERHQYSGQAEYRRQSEAIADKYVKLRRLHISHA
jgi:hypothetical protein